MRLLQRPRVLVVVLLFALAAFPLAAVEKPSLVVVISVDQMRADYLERFRPYFGKDGFNRFLERGAQFPEARHRHAATSTAPGHASIGTGLDPRDHGIIANRWYDLEEKREVVVPEDRAARWVGLPSGLKPAQAPASPVLLQGAFLGDRLKESFPESQVVSVSLKDRAGVLMAGRKADAVVWFERNLGRFVSSNAYSPRASLLRFNDRLPDFFANRKVWNLSGKIPPNDLERIVFDPPEIFPVKRSGDVPEEMGKTFPHPLPNAKALAASPFGDELVLELARFVIKDLDLGRRNSEGPDLLFVGMSSADYYGHAFGPDSREVADGMVRLDEALENFFQWLDANVGSDRALLFLTSDHGIAPLPEVTRSKHQLSTGKDDPLVAGRFHFSKGLGKVTVRDGSPDRVALELHLAKKFGYTLRTERPNESEGTIAYFYEGLLRLNRAVLARRGLPVEKVKEAVRDWLRRRPEVLLAYTNTEIGNGLPARAPHSLAIERSFRADRSGDIQVILKPGWIWSYGNATGTAHGQPHDYDARVPLLVWGAGVKPGSWDIRVSPLSIARTIAALFNFEAGAADAEILEPVLGREMGTKKVAARR